MPQDRALGSSGRFRFCDSRSFGGPPSVRERGSLVCLPRAATPAGALCVWTVVVPLPGVGVSPLRFVDGKTLTRDFTPCNTSPLLPTPKAQQARASQTRVPGDIAQGSHTTIKSPIFKARTNQNVYLVQPHQFAERSRGLQKPRAFSQGHTWGPADSPLECGTPASITSAP